MDNKKILIVANRLESGGVEVSLINFIKEMKKNPRYDIDLLVSVNKGFYKDEINNIVNVQEIPYTKKYYNMYYNIEEVSEFGKYNKFRFYFFKLIRNVLRKIKKVNLFYNYILNKTKTLSKDYDLVIDFHSYGYFNTAYVSKKIKSKYKIMFIHDENIKFISEIEEYLEGFDRLLCVSNSVLNKVGKQYNVLLEKLLVFHNIIDEEGIIKKAMEPINVEFAKNTFNILTIGRLEYQKGYDLLLDVAKELNENNINYNWYIIGDGSLKEEILSMIKKYGLSNKVKLLGKLKNPYPYIKKAKIYVQTSRHEGYGLAIAEARTLKKPVIASNIESIKEQMIEGKEGYICEFQKEDFYEKIVDLYKNEEKIEKIKKYLENKKTEGFANDMYIIDEILEEKSI